MIELKWTRDECVMGFIADWGDVAAIDIWPHGKGGWSWCVVSADAEEEVPEGWDPTLEGAKAHSERAYFEWRDIIEGREALPDEHDETADIVAEAVAKERAAVVAWLRERQEAAEWALTAAGYEHAADAIERGEHRREEKP